MKSRLFVLLRPRSPWTRVSLLLLGALGPMANGCKKSAPEGQSSSSGSTSASTTPSSVASVTGASAPSGSTVQADASVAVKSSALCTVKAGPTVIDRYVRIEAGLTVAEPALATAPEATADAGSIGDASASEGAAPGKPAVLALGYARALGKPAVAVVGDDGVAKVLSVPSTLTELETKPPADVRRVVRRVVPLTMTATSAEAAVDYVDFGPNKTRSVHCGPANGKAWVSTSGPSPALGATEAQSETLECASGANGGVSESKIAIEGDELIARWVVDGSVRLEKRVKLAGNEKQMERYAFTMLGASVRGDTFTSRYNGKLVRSDEGDASKWLGASVSGMATDGATVVTLQGKPEVFWGGGDSDRFENGAPQKEPLGPANLETPDGLEERSAPAIGGRYLAVREKIAGKYSARIARRGVGSTAFVVERPNVTLHAVQVHELSGTDVFVATLYLDPKNGGTVDGMVLSCP